MLLKNNERLDYAVLEERLAQDAPRAARRPAGATFLETRSGNVQETRQNTTMTGATSGGPVEIGMPYIQKRRSLPKKVALWFKGLFRLYRLQDQKAEADSRYWDLLGTFQTLEQRMTQMLAEVKADFHAFEARMDVFETRFDDFGPCFAAKQDDENRRLFNEVGGLRREIMFQQRRLTQLALPAPAAEKAAIMARVADERLDSFYVAFEDVFRGARDDIKGRLLRYIDVLRGAGAGHLGKPVLDIGCGRGEWLELLKEHNIPAYGIDINSVMVERTAALGLDARSEDALEHMKGLPGGAVSALTAFHVVEHLPFGVLIDFFDEALRVLAPGGVAIFETPNPETMRVGATTFYNDPTHRNPIPPQVLQFMAAHRGFQDVEILRLHPFTDGLLRQPTADAELLNRVIFGPQDYAVIARRL